MKQGVLCRILSISVVLALQACAAGSVQKETTLVWPNLPEEPRIAYVGSLRGAIDYQEFSFFDRLFGAVPEGQLRKPYGVAAMKDKVYVTDTGNMSVTVMDTKARKVTYLGQAGRERLRVPTGVAVASDGWVFVSDSEIGVIFAIDETGRVKKTLGTKGELRRPAGLAISHATSRLYAADVSAHKVQVFSLSGEYLFAFGQLGPQDGEFNTPTNVAVDEKSGTVYVADTSNFRIQAFDLDGKFLRKFGELADTAGNFSRPKGIGVDSEGHVYVVDSAFSNYQIFESDGRVLLAVGHLGSGPGALQSPAGLFIDDQDRIYVADQANHRVEMYQYLSERWKKEHPEEYKKYQAQQ